MQLLIQWNLFGRRSVQSPFFQIRRFGAFATRQRRGRIGRNPKTGEQVQVPPKRVPYLRPSTGLPALINGPAVSPGGRGG